MNRDEKITREYFYKQCFPLFKSIFEKYYTGCESWKEFADEIYIHILTVRKESKSCPLEGFRGESTLTSWLKTVCIFYCIERFKVKKRLPIYTETEISPNESDSFEFNGGSMIIDEANINKKDADILLALMPNKRYSQLLRLRYLKELSHEETAKALGMTMKNYYNKHHLAKEQYDEIIRKEESYE